MYKKYFKRIIDFILSLTALVFFSPVIVILALSIRKKLGSPVIFKQMRPGKDERIFTMCKFRTMTDERDENGALLPDSIRLTEFGRFLRSTSLDELPEIWNILKGDMSIVGPRPQLVKDLVFMDEEQRKRQVVMPGLTGWAQINGRNGISWEDKLALDLEYIQNITFTGDMKIILGTVAKVFKREGIGADGMDTAEDFGDYLLKEKKVSSDQYMYHVERSRQMLSVTR